MKLLLVGLVLAALSVGMMVGSAPARAAAPQTYYVAAMNMDVNPGSDNYVVNSLNSARGLGADHFVLILNTFGGDGHSMDDIIGAISNYQAGGGTFITLIAPSGAHAFSAGSYIAEASDKIYMTPGTTIGSATPIVSGIPTGEENTTMTKDINGFTTYMESITARFGRNSTAAGLMVSKGVSYTADQAYKLNLITAVVNATSVPGALGMIGVPAGTAVNTPGPAPVLVGILSDPNVSGLLFLVGVFAILADLYHPTIILSVVGAAVIILALVGLGLFGASITAVLLMFIGALFIFLEVKTHHGVSAAAGVVIFAVGLLLVFQSPPTPPSLPPGQPPVGNFVAVGLTTYALLALLGSAIIIGSFYLYRLREQVLRRAKTFDPRALVGKDGRMTSDLIPEGTATALVGSEEWSVTSTEGLRKGEEVRIKDVKGLKLVVEKKG